MSTPATSPGRFPFGSVAQTPAGMKTGGPNSGGGPISTAGGLVFIGASKDRVFHAFSAKTGEELWSTQLEEIAQSVPITWHGSRRRAVRRDLRRLEAPHLQTARLGDAMISRRTFGKLALASLPAAAAWGKIDSTIHGVRIGVSGYSFQHSSLDEAIRHDEKHRPGRYRGVVSAHRAEGHPRGASRMASLRAD